MQPEKKDERYLIGIIPSYEPLADKYRTELKYDILSAFWKSLEKVAGLVKTILQFIGNLLTGELSLKIWVVLFLWQKVPGLPLKLVGSIM
ncbi:putative zinc metalloprotease [Actinobacillus equuli]|nr:putative zinc metalloprotease [Actinobacillus equuli]